MDDNPKEQKREGFFSSLKKRLSRSQENKNDPSADRDEFLMLLKDYSEKGIITYDEMEMMGNIINLAEKEAQDVMIHKSSISAMDGEQTIAEIFGKIMSDGFSRYPVYMGEPDNIVGFFHIRDFLRAYADVRERNEKLKETHYDVVKDVLMVPDTLDVGKLFRAMQNNKAQMAIVKDEYGQLAGLATMEDILEEIFGNIWDEHDKPDTGIKVITKDKVFSVDGTALLDDLEKTLNIAFENAGDIETLNGLITSRIGHIPEEEDIGYAFIYGGYSFKVTQISNKVVKKVRIQKF